jgi:glyoxylase-like metal-dependent hydrolase (beta-lactamase superfamily II)
MNLTRAVVSWLAVAAVLAFGGPAARTAAQEPAAVCRWFSPLEPYPTPGGRKHRRADKAQAPSSWIRFDGSSDRVLAEPAADAAARSPKDQHEHGSRPRGGNVCRESRLSILAGNIVAGAGLSDDLITNGGGASVLAHENVLTRMSAPTGRQSLFPLAFWPTKTFAFHQYSMYLNGEGIQVIHQPAAHTDGDTIVFFRRGDVIATGDIVDTTRFPVIDVKRGGTIQGEIDALNRLMDISIHNLPIQWYADRTLLVPGHGHVYDKLDLLEYRDAITVVRDRIQSLIAEGKSLDQIKAANPTLGYRSQYGADSGPWTTDMFVEVIYRELSAKRGKS